MNFESKNPLDIYHDLRNSLERMGITNFGDSSIANIIITLIADNYKENVEHIKAVLSALDFQTATGKDLNAIATLFGLQRIQVSRASSSSYERNIKIRVSSGTFGDLNNGADIVIPIEGTVFYYESADKTRRIEYRLKSQLTLLADQSNAYANVEAIVPGKNSNISKKILTKHNIESFPTLRITNDYPIINGQDEESDESLRFRISNFLLLKNSFSKEAIVASLPLIAGISEYKFIPYLEGAGTNGLIIDFYDNDASPNYVSSISRTLQRRVSAGEKLIVQRVKQRKLRFEISTTSTSATPIIETQINRILNDVFSEMQIGTELDASSLENRFVQEITTVSAASITLITIDDIDEELNSTTTFSPSLLISCGQDQKLFLNSSPVSLTNTL